MNIEKENTTDFNLDLYRDNLPGETVYENKGVCVKKQDDKIFFWFDNPLDRKCIYLVFGKDAALESANKIIAAYQGEKVG